MAFTGVEERKGLRFFERSEMAEEKKMNKVDLEIRLEEIVVCRKDETEVDAQKLIPGLLKKKNGFYFLEEEGDWVILVRIPKKCVLDIMIQHINLQIYCVRNGIVWKAAFEYFGSAE